MKKKCFIALIIGLVIGLFAETLLGLLNIDIMPNKFSSFNAPVPKNSGDSAIARFKDLWNYRKPFGKGDSTRKYITGLYIDSIGIRQIVNDSNFKGLYIDLGLRRARKKKTIELLFSGLMDTDTRNAKGEPVTKRYFYKKIEETGRAEGEDSYLDKVNPCPGSPGCPEQE